MINLLRYIKDWYLDLDSDNRIILLAIIVGLPLAIYFPIIFPPPFTAALLFGIIAGAVSGMVVSVLLNLFIQWIGDLRKPEIFTNGNIKKIIKGEKRYHDDS